MSPILAQSPPKGKPPGCTFFPQTNRGDRGAGQRLKDAVLDAEKAVHAAQGLRDEKRAELAATKKKKLRPVSFACLRWLCPLPRCPAGDSR